MWSKCILRKRKERPLNIDAAKLLHCSEIVQPDILNDAEKRTKLTGNEALR